jgi:hypothetical protein
VLRIVLVLVVVLVLEKRDKVGSVNFFGVTLRNDAGFFEAEIAAPARSGCADDDEIYQLKLQNSAGFENSPGKPQIRFRRRRITGGMIVHQDEGVGRVSDHGLKDFSRVAERFVHAALAHRADLNEVLLGVEKNDTQTRRKEGTYLD